MSEKDLNDLFVDTLKDIYYAEKQIYKSLPKMAKAAASDQLREAFEKHHDETEGQIERLEKIFGGRLAKGSFGLVSGPGEAGKGMFSMDLLARITTGAAFPGESRTRPPSSVLVCVTEDSASRVKSRLRAAAANLDLVYLVEGPEMKRGGLVMPSFDDAHDEEAKAVLANCFADREIVTIPALDIVAGGGGIHCITQQEPA